MKKKYSKKLDILYNADLIKLDKKIKRKTSLFFPKFFIALSIFRIGSEIIIDNITEQPPLPYDDSQKIPMDNLPSYEDLQLHLAKQSYANLINILNEKAMFYNVDLSSYDLYSIAYDEVSQNTVFIFKNNEKFINLEFDFSQEEIKQCVNNHNLLCDKLSGLYVLAKSNTLKNIPTISQVDNNIQGSVFQDFTVMSISQSTLSIGDERTYDPHNFVAGRNYMYFNIYGRVENNEQSYFSTITVAITEDNYEILEIENLQDFFIKDPKNPKLIINTTSQYEETVLKELNLEINKIKKYNKNLSIYDFSQNN